MRKKDPEKLKVKFDAWINKHPEINLEHIEYYEDVIKKEFRSDWLAFMAHVFLHHRKGDGK